MNGTMIRICRVLAVTLFSVCALWSSANATLVTAEQICSWVDDVPATPTSVTPRAALYTQLLAGAQKLEMRFRPELQGWKSAVLSLYNPQGKAELQLRIIPPCNVIQGRELIRRDGQVVEIATLDAALKPVSLEPQNPPFVAGLPVPAHHQAPFLALVDTGVNYLLPEFQRNLARGTDGQLLGYDFWDEDKLPFDKDPRRNPFYPLHHGSTVFSILNKEADTHPIAIYRFPALNMCRFSSLIKHASALGIRIITMSMGSVEQSDWQCFYEEAAKHQQILFTVSAGNDGMDISKAPVYPASFDLENMLVVTSSDLFGRLGIVSNYSKTEVDVMVPAEQVEVIDHRGVRVMAGGSSFAAPRLAALAARYLRANPTADTQQIIRFIRSRGIVSAEGVTRFGWIPDPGDDFGFNLQTPH